MIIAATQYPGANFEGCQRGDYSIAFLEGGGGSFFLTWRLGDKNARSMRQ